MSKYLDEVKREDIIYVWPQIWPLIDKMVVSHSMHTGEAFIGQLLNNLTTGYAQLWVTHNKDIDNPEAKIDAAMFTTIEQTGDKTFCYIIGVAGEGLFDSFKHFESFKQWARANQVKEIVTYTRESLAKKLRKLGFWVHPHEVNENGYHKIVYEFEEAA
jgi:hypothetical protein